LRDTVALSLSSHAAAKKPKTLWLENSAGMPCKATPVGDLTGVPCSPCATAGICPINTALNTIEERGRGGSLNERKGVFFKKK
jgi:hypothetical protein